MKTRNLHYSGLLTFLFLSLLAGRGWAVINVPGDVDTLPHSLLTATATPNSVVNLQGTNPVPSATVVLGAVNTSLTIQGDSIGTTWTDTSSNDLITINSSLLSPVTIKNFTMAKIGATSGRMINWSGIGVGSSLMVDNMAITTTSNQANVLGTVVFAGINQFIINRSKLSNANSNLKINALEVVAGAVLLENSLLIGGIGIAGNIENYSVSSNATLKIYNSIIAGGVTGIYSLGAVDVKNTLIYGQSVTNVNFTAPASDTQLTYCGFNQNLASVGTGCLTITAAREFCNQALYFLSPASLSRTAGISITGVTDQAGLNGVNLQNGCPSGSAAMGCMGCSSALCGRPNYSGVAQ